jgi:hypothetical protein
MTRLLLAVALMAGCGKDEPPPQPLGCKHAKVAFDKVEAGFAALSAKAAGVDKDVYCTKLEAAAGAASALSMALFAESLGNDTKAKAASAVRSHTQGLVTAVGQLADRCAQEGIAGTQAAIAKQIAKARAAVEKSCAEAR